MENIYSTAKICDYSDKTKCELALEPELTEIMATSRNPEELKYVWLEWRKASGEKMRSMFPKYIELSNIAARKNDYDNKAELWLSDYEADDITDQIGRTIILSFCLFMSSKISIVVVYGKILFFETRECTKNIFIIEVILYFEAEFGTYLDKNWKPDHKCLKKSET